MRITNIAAQTVSTRYFHTDHLGSVAVITDENAVVVERLSYDAWGKRRFANGADDPTGSITSQSSRGFTGQEELDTVALVHLNGRVYDPMVGRMISADPTVPDPMNAQAWNRYSYVGNDPLAFTDPSGFSWLSSFFHSVVNFLTHNPIIKAILQIGITAILTPFLGPLAAMIGFTGSAILGAAGAAAAFAGAAIVTGLSGGNLGQMLKAGVIAGATAFAFFEVGDLTPGAAHAFDSSQFNPTAYAENVAGHALVGCASSAASGGSCKSGAVSGAISAGAGPLINGQSGGAALVEHAVLGGIGSVAGGGKFANGAITGAFGYMFNDFIHSDGHEYGPSLTYICDTSNPGCSAASAFGGLLRNAYPGQPSGTVVDNGGSYTTTIAGPYPPAPIGQPIITSIDYDNLSVTNTTAQDHIFCCGSVTRSIVEEGSSIYVNTYGSGTNSNLLLATVNYVMGYMAFSAANEGVRQYVQHQGRLSSYGLNN